MFDTIKNKKLILGIYLSVPVLSIIISFYHIISFYQLTNGEHIAILLSLAVELGSIMAFVMLFISDQVNKTMLWMVFVMLAGLQMIGNVFYSYNILFNSLQANKDWLTSMIAFFQEFGIFEGNVNIILSMISVLPIPLISLFFIKSMLDFKFKEEQPIIQPPAIQPVSIIETPAETVVSQPQKVVEPVPDYMMDNIIGNLQNERN